VKKITVKRELKYQFKTQGLTLLAVIFIIGVAISIIKFSSLGYLSIGFVLFLFILATSIAAQGLSVEKNKLDFEGE
jgi:hypothetical protein